MRVRTSWPRFVRLCIGAVFSCALALGFAIVGTQPAYAASDQIDSFDISYEIQPSGALLVHETIVYRFGDDSGRHGIERTLTTREPYDDDNDAVYEISDIEVSTPSGAPDEFTTRERGDDRDESLVIRIGDPDVTIGAPTATYELSYEVTGAMRTFSGYDEFYWDATGLDGDASINEVTISVTVPGGAQDVTCTTGYARSETECETADFEKGGSATFKQSDLSARQGVTVGVKITSGLVTDNAPHLEPNGSVSTPLEKASVAAMAGIGGVLAVGSPILGVLWWRKNGRDQRYTNLAPGTVPLPGAPVEVGAHDPDIPIPVAFSPPKIPVAEAGLLIDGQVDARETAETIVDLAVRGALTVQSSSKDEFTVTLVDPNLAAAPHEMVLMTSLFSGRPPGEIVDLSKRGSMLAAHSAMVNSVRSQVTSRGWFRKVPSASATGGIGIGAFIVAGVAIYQFGSSLLWIALPLLPIVITFLIVRGKLRRGQRTPDGRAVCDQVEGFKTYLATAEAEQLRFEEGEDIFSKYLPWAIAFDLADRWATVCGALVAAGRLPDQQPSWYVGNYNMAAFNTGFLASSLTNAATPQPSSSSGSGFGGGSSFSGGGFSGGGGGGGGTGSW